MSNGLWVGAVTTLAGAILGGAISFLLSRQQIIEARAQRAEEASRDKSRRSLERRFDAYANFLKQARSYRNAIRSPVTKEAAINEIDTLAHATDAVGSLVFLATESEMTFAACRKVLAAIDEAQDLFHDSNQHSRKARWPEANEAMSQSVRQFQIAARDELAVGGVDQSSILA